MSHKMLSKQLTLPLLLAHSIKLELKPYIQPFEKILAKYELEGLLRPKGASFSIIEIRNNKASFPTKDKKQYGKLRERLAYWQRIGIEEPEPTKQALIEMSDNFYTNGDNGKDYPSRRRLRYGPHDIHEYRGKFFPQLVKALINYAGLHERSVVLDPMCGSGTTNCEARSMGMRTIGIDMNPLSVEIARTKTGIIEVHPNDLNRELDNIITIITRKDSESLKKRRWIEEDMFYMRRWFSEEAISDIDIMLMAIESCKIPTIRSLAEISLSNILRKISWQKEKDLRVRKEIRPYKKGDALSLFSKELNRQKGKLTKYLEIIQNREKLPSYVILEGDSRRIDTELKRWRGKCDALITSPPYAMALPYIDTDRLSLIVLGLLSRKEHQKRNINMIGNREISEAQRSALWEEYLVKRSELPDALNSLIERVESNNRSEKVGFRKRNLPALLAKYFLDMSGVMKNSLKMMKPGSYGFFIVGNNSTWIKEGKIEIPTNQYLWAIGKLAGWKQEQIINMELLPSRDIFKNNRSSSETILVFRA